MVESKHAIMVCAGFALLVFGLAKLPPEAHSPFQTLFFGGWSGMVFLFIAANMRQWRRETSKKRQKMALKRMEQMNRGAVRKLGRVRSASHG